MPCLTLVRLVVASLLFVACGEAETAPAPQRPAAPGAPATLAQLLGPWQATPLVLDLMARTRVEQACSRDIEMPPGSRAVLVDARGAGVVSVVMRGQTAGGCYALEIMANGQITGAGGGWRADRLPGLPVLGESELADIEQQTVSGGNLKVVGWSVVGRAGPAITSVLVAPQGHPVVTATLENGWFGAWWPARPGDPSPDDGRFLPIVVGGYDAFGVLQDEVRP